MKWYLRRLGEGSDEYANCRRGVVTMVVNGQIGCQYLGERIAPRDEDQENQAGHQYQAASRCDEETLQGAFPGFCIFMVEADQHVGRDAGQFPEHEKSDEVVG